MSCSTLHVPGPTFDKRRPAARPHTHRIAAPDDIAQSERLARRWFSLVEHRQFGQLGEYVHPEVVLVSKIRPGIVVEGREAFLRFVEETLAESLHDAATSTFRALDDERIVVEGRLRWMDEEHVLRDDDVTWAMSFDGGLLRVMASARTAVEAESVLSRSAQ